MSIRSEVVKPVKNTVWSTRHKTIPARTVQLLSKSSKMDKKQAENSEKPRSSSRSSKSDRSKSTVTDTNSSQSAERSLSKKSVQHDATPSTSSSSGSKSNSAKDSGQHDRPGQPEKRPAPPRTVHNISRSRSASPIVRERSPSPKRVRHNSQDYLINELLHRIESLERQKDCSQSVADTSPQQWTDNMSDMFNLGNDDNEEGEIEDSSYDFSDLLLEGTAGTKKGQPLGDDGLKVASLFFDNDFDKSLLKPILERHCEPENCENLSAKLLNQEVFRSLPSWPKKRDIKLCNIQGSVAASATSSLRLLDTVTELCRAGQLEKASAKTLLSLACDASKLAAKAYSDVSLLRKASLKPHLDQKYQSLCERKTFGPQLFGDDLTKEIKTIDDESKVMRNIGKAPYRRFNPGFQNPKNFSARGRGQFRPHNRGQRPFKFRRGQHRGQSNQQNAQSSQ